MKKYKGWWVNKLRSNDLSKIHIEPWDLYGNSLEEAITREYPSWNQVMDHHYLLVFEVEDDGQNRTTMV